MMSVDMESPTKKSKRELSPELKESWISFGAEISRFQKRGEEVSSNLAFSYIEGTLVQAVRKVVLYYIMIPLINPRT